jgi:tetratricopeptide (TPR) repeat protein
MRFRVRSILAGIACAVLLFPLEAMAEAPSHQHYEKPEGYDRPSQGGAVAPRLQNLGTHTFKVTTTSGQAQLFINQGVILAYGFNHAEAARAFAEAARLDPECPMAYWGHALVLGPNINAPMNPEDEPKAHELAKKAMALKSNATPRERAYIEAIAARYTGRPEDRKNADRAFADAMRKVVDAYPDDLDAATIFAEALMDLRPWNYWTRDGKPYPETEAIVLVLQSVISRNPNHPGAVHYWIHLWEATDTPERAEAEADRLLTLVPGAGHLVHMPGHIYARVGRYADVVKANRMAIAADEDYITQCRAQGIYPLAYYPHNLHFLWMGASMAGRSRLAIDAADKTAKVIPPGALQEMPFLQGFLAVPYWTKVRFGLWDEILAYKAPARDTLFLRGVRHYARASAFIGKRRLKDAERELKQLRSVLADPALAKEPASFSANTAASILRIAGEAVAGEIAGRKGDIDRALLHLERAVRFQDALIYTEPPDWHAPVRQTLGAVLLEAGRPAEAEVVYWEDLRQNPENGWSLFGLAQSLRAQGRSEEAAEVEKRFHIAWADADVELESSRSTAHGSSGT